jgi:RNA recognition motif-containing protein
MATKLFVGNMPYMVKERDLRALFGQAGQVRKVAFILDRETQEPKGFGFVEMSTQAEADKAIQLFNAHAVEGRRLTVNLARPRVQRAPNGSGNES